jgi:hypothetical protein
MSSLGLSTLKAVTRFGLISVQSYVAKQYSKPSKRCLFRKEECKGSDSEVR